MGKNYADDPTVWTRQLPLVVGETLSQVLTIEADALKLVAYENEDGHTIKSALQSVHTKSNFN